MNYVLISMGNLPDHIKYTVNTILSIEEEPKIFLCTDRKINFKHKNIININLKDTNSTKLEYIKNLKIFDNSIFESNPLWQSSLLRLFYLEPLKKYLGIDSFIHFDNDVLIYKNFDHVKNYLDSSKFNITPASEKLCIFGYSYIHNVKPLNIIYQKIIETAEFGVKHNWKFNYGKPFNEMRFLGTIQKDNSELFNLLPIFPYDAEYPFDPAGYGQFLDGTFVKPKKFYSSKYTNINEFIGREIISKRIKVIFKENKPQVIWNNRVYDLVNLHIHSKRMSKFLPTNYKKFVY